MSLQHKQCLKAKAWPVLHEGQDSDPVSLLRTTAERKGRDGCVQQQHEVCESKRGAVTCRGNLVIQRFLIVRYSAQHINQCKYDQCSLGERSQAVKGDIAATHLLAEDVPNCHYKVAMKAAQKVVSS